MRLAIVVIALAGLPALATASGRRLLVLLVAVPGSAFAVSLLSYSNVDFYSMSLVAAMFGLYLPPVALAALVFLAARRYNRQSRPPEAGAGA